MSESRVTVNEEAIKRKLREATTTKLRNVASEIIEKSQCDEHSEFRPTLEFSADGMNVAFRGACCDAFKTKIEAVRESYFRNENSQ